MKEGLVNRKRAVVADHESAEVAQPREGAFDGPASPVAAQRSAVLGRWLAPILAMRGDQLDAARRQLLPQRVAIVTAVGDEANRLLPRSPGPMPSPYADGRSVAATSLTSDGEAE